MVRAYDVRTGAFRWGWNPVPPGKAALDSEGHYVAGTTNVWSTISVDRERNLVIVPTGGLHALACLEGDATGGRRKGVQRRDFLKRHRFELAGVGGFYASDALSSTYSYGGAVAFYPSEDFGLEVLVTRSLVRFRLEEPFN